jgi:hypothetical protein
MPVLLAQAVCCLFRCQNTPETCVCARCGRTNHQWVKIPQVESCEFEFRGMNSNGEMVYSETVRHQHICSRCDAEKIKITRQHVRH